MASLIPLNQIPTLTQLYKAGRLTPPPPSSSTQFTPSTTLNAKIRLIRADITTLKVDAIVNAANNELRPGGGVDRAIHNAAGPGLAREGSTLNGCATGSAKITGAYNLPCKKVIHTVGPIYMLDSQDNNHEALLRGCYRRCLELAVENGLRSLAFSAVSTGVYGYPSVEAARVALHEVRMFLGEEAGWSLEAVVFCTFLKKDEDAYEKFAP